MKKNKLIELTKDLITYKTVRPDTSDIRKDRHRKTDFANIINDCMDYAVSNLDKSIIIDRADGLIEDASCPVTIAKFQATSEPELLLIGHIDVVDGNDSQFHPFEKDGKIYGRGAKDMKAGVAAMIEVMNHYASCKVRPNIAIALVSDEEVGGYNGANFIIKKMGYSPKFVISPDPGERHCIINKEKGFLWGTFSVHGKSSHPSRPWLGDSAILESINIWNNISAVFNLAKDENDWESSACLLDIKRVFIDKTGTLSPDTSTSTAGLVICKFDIRITEKYDFNNVKLILHNIIENNCSMNKVEFNRLGPVCFTPDNNIYIQQLKQSAELTENISIPVAHSSGASDLRFFSEMNIPCANFGPDGKNHHADNEFVTINSIDNFCKTIIHYVDKNILKGKS